MNAPAPKTAADPTPEEMEKRVARFDDLVPYKDTMNATHGIDPEAMQMMSSDKVFPVMSPEGWAGRSKVAPVKGAPGLTVTIAECPPGDSSGLASCEWPERSEASSSAPSQSCGPSRRGSMTR